MKKDAIYRWKNPPIADGTDVRDARSQDPASPETIETRRISRRPQQDKDAYLPDPIATSARIFIIEGISGSGKDTFQTYLKEKFAHREVYDFSEGELLHSWKHVPIAGLLKLKVRFMGLFVDYLQSTVRREEKSVFLLNRFHLSTYAAIITRQPELKREYDEILDVLRTLPVHVFLLQLGQNEIERRSLHSERSGVWPKLRRQMVARDGFQNRVAKYISQQNLMVEAVERQGIPCSILKNFNIADVIKERVRVARGRSIRRPGAPLSDPESHIFRRKRTPSRALSEGQ